MTNHSPEPWTLLPYSGEAPHFSLLSVTSADGKTFFCAVAGESAAQAWANRKRIAACVNALAGLDTETLSILPTGSVGELLRDVFSMPVKVTGPFHGHPMSDVIQAFYNRDKKGAKDGTPKGIGVFDAETGARIVGERYRLVPIKEPSDEQYAPTPQDVANAGVIVRGPPAAGTPGTEGPAGE